MVFSKRKVIVGVFLASGVFLTLIGTTLATDILSKEKEDSQYQSDLDSQREKDLEKWSESGFGNVNLVLKETNRIVTKIDSTIADLKTAARRANASANYVGFIVEEYSDYHRENYSYDFVLEKVNPARNAYVKISNSLKDVRNRA